MNLLINEPPLQVLPSLAKKVGLNEAIFLQQLHFRLQISTNLQEGHKWIYKTYEEWQEEFPFWSRDTVKRTVAKLEKEGYLITTSKFNKMKMDKTKWYRIEYSKMAVSPTGQNAPSMGADCTEGKGQNAPSDGGKMHPAIPKDIKSNKKYNVEQLDNVRSVIDYLNEKTKKQFKHTTADTRQKIIARFNEGFSVEDCKRVIDVKCKDWLNDPYWEKFLRPQTLFGNKYEAYLNEAPKIKPTTQTPQYQPPQLDFRAGEEV